MCGCLSRSDKLYERSFGAPTTRGPPTTSAVVRIYFIRERQTQEQQIENIGYVCIT